MRTRRPSADDDSPDVALPPHGAAPPPTTTVPRMPCPGCSTPIDATELATYGNRCRQCYEAFCSANTKTRAHLPTHGGPLGWAQTIVERHRQGESITPVQLQMARNALQPRVIFTGDDA